MRGGKPTRFEVAAPDRAKVAVVEWEMVTREAKKHWQRILTRMTLLDSHLAVNEKADLLGEIFGE